MLRTFRPVCWKTTMMGRTRFVTDKSNKTTKRTKRKNHRRAEAEKKVRRCQGKKGNRIMTRSILSLILLTTLAAGGSLNAEPTPKAERNSSQNAKKRASQRPQAKTDAPSQIQPAPSLAEGWNHVKGEWIHSDGYKYVKGQVVRTGSQTHKKPPKPPSKALLNSVRIRPTPAPDPNSAAAKAAERERNLRPRPAPQTGSHL